MEKVYFIGAGPGDPELITIKGQRIVKEADIVIYAVSLVPREVIECHGCNCISNKSCEKSCQSTYWRPCYIWCT